jgi:Asp-tRNA(Asn)/Glu-tRNA(Gln) amidotransferase A subunit family amidase
VDDELAYADVFALRREQIAAAGLVENLIERIATLNAPDTPTALRIVLAVSEAARHEARGCDRTEPLGPFARVPILVKDNVEVARLPCTAGATSLIGRAPAADAPLVRRVRDAGAVILGTTNLSE